MPPGLRDSTTLRRFVEDVVTVSCARPVPADKSTRWWQEDDVEFWKMKERKGKGKGIVKEDLTTKKKKSTERIVNEVGREKFKYRGIDEF